MEEANIFQSEVHYDLATYKDFNRINTYTLPRITLCGLIYLVCMIYLLSMMEHSFTAKTVLALSLFALGMWAYQWFRNRDGGIPYKRMLRNNKDEIPRYLITVDENGITTKNLTSENEITNSFSQIRYMLESQRLLILVDDLKTAHIIDKSTLTGGGRDALVCFLRKHCPSLKKRVRKGVLGRILWYLMRILPILMLLISIASLFQIPEKLRGQITGNVSYEEIAEDLLPLGIEISPEAISELNQYAGENPLDIISDGTIKVLNLLCWEGQGRFEKNVFYQEGPMEAYDWSWVPSTSGVYWFDLEVMDCSAIYTDFLRGVEAMDENLSFTNVTEDYSAVAGPVEGNHGAAFVLGQHPLGELFRGTVVLVAPEAVAEYHDLADVLYIPIIQLAADVVPAAVDFKISVHSITPYLSVILPQPDKKRQGQKPLSGNYWCLPNTSEPFLPLM